MSSAARRSSASSRATSVSRAPSSASSRAMTRPSPREPPVMRTDLPAKSYVSRRRHICAARSTPAPTAPIASIRFCCSVIAMGDPARNAGTRVTFRRFCATISRYAARQAYGFCARSNAAGRRRSPHGRPLRASRQAGRLGDGRAPDAAARPAVRAVPGVLPHHPRWAKLFENLRYVVIDELHAYRGVFGSHLTNVLRRMRRICRHYGSSPTFICSSATIANPKELAEALVEQPFELVSESGAPRGEKFFLFVNPPVVNQQLGIRRSYLAETRRIAAEFLKRQLQLIVFAQSRLTTEILTTYLKDDFGGQPGTQEQIRGYRGGYLPQ